MSKTITLKHLANQLYSNNNKILNKALLAYEMKERELV